MQKRMKKNINVTVSPYVMEKISSCVGEGKRFASLSDCVNTALVEMFHTQDLLELARLQEKEGN